MLAPLLAAGLMAATLAGCGARRAAKFASQYFSGPSPVVECRKTDGFEACRYHPKDLVEDPGSALYFLHYAEGDAKSFSRVGLAQGFYAEYRRKGRRPPRVTSLSYGPHWLLTERPGKRQTVLLDAFHAALVKLEDIPPKRRFAWGLSQGGYNSAAAVLGRPDRWAAAALSCPALYSENPFTADAGALAERARVPAAVALDGLALFNTRLADAAVWDAENPLARVRAGAAAPPMLIDANVSDEFGFLEGARALADALKAAGRRVTFRELPGGHCVVDGKAAAELFMSVTTD